MTSPAVPVDEGARIPREVVQRAQRALAESFAAVGRDVGGWVVKELPGSLLVASPGHSAAFNRLFVFEPGPAATAALQFAANVYRERRSSWALIAVPDAGQDLAEPALDAGLEPGPPLPLMVLEPLGGHLAREAAFPLEIRVVRDPRGATDFLRAAAGGFGSGREPFEPYFAVSPDGPPGSTFYVGYLNEVPIASGTLSVAHGVGAIANIATLPVYRRRGAGRAMTQRLLQDALAAGCDAAALTATARGRRLYRDVGFEHVQDYATWDSV